MNEVMSDDARIMRKELEKKGDQWVKIFDSLDQDSQEHAAALVSIMNIHWAIVGFMAAYGPESPTQ